LDKSRCAPENEAAGIPVRIKRNWPIQERKESKTPGPLFDVAELSPERRLLGGTARTAIISDYKMDEGIPSKPTVDFAPVSYLYDQNQKVILLDHVNDSVITHPKAVKTLNPLKFLGTRWTGMQR